MFVLQWLLFSFYGFAMPLQDKEVQRKSDSIHALLSFCSFNILKEKESLRNLLMDNFTALSYPW